ncbi:hypothetical protein DDK22_36755 [Cupriavidus necator]|uniref:Uncharacterized protein n=1 Tax=Cupriavidus necator TaxID=106590 RepID=A0A367P7N1_CUPNE|nr:hypothetical protein DDK22_36755 [Cupriavidus necator]
MVLPRGNATRLSALPACRLQESDLTIGEVALVGSSSQNSRGHWLRAAFGCTMAQWRRQAADHSRQTDNAFRRERP